MTLDLAVGSWIGGYTRIDALVERTADSATYRVLHGDCVPQTLLLRRYDLGWWPIELRAMAKEAGVHQARAIDGVFEVLGFEREMAELDARLRSALRE